MLTNDYTITLPSPWTPQAFKLPPLGFVNFLVGPNGSGKSRFADAIKQALPGARLLSTDRLKGMEKIPPLNFLPNYFAQGIAKNYFDQIKAAGIHGLGLDTFVLREERLDLRIRVESVQMGTGHQSRIASSPRPNDAPGS